tara:strand:- start:61 stop:417 length:357 start_codon:yes stop_codon:yes gene_type:complete
MKIQVTKIEAGQTIKVGSLNDVKEKLAYYTEEAKLEDASDIYLEFVKETEFHIEAGAEAYLKTEGKHTIELKVLEVRDILGCFSISYGSRAIGANYAMLVTDKGTFLAANRNKVTLVD